MRKFALLLLALAAFPLCAATYGTIVFRDGDRHYTDGDSDDADHATGLGRYYAFFERDGVAYVIDDESALARIRKIVKPQTELGRQQAKLGTQQAALGMKQAALGAKQAALGAQQAATTSGARSRALAGKQRELSDQQRDLSDQQRPLGEQQRVLGAKQREASREARQLLEQLFDDAVRDGVAKRR